MASDLIRLAASDWTADIQLDIEDPFTLRFLSAHRVLTVVGADNVPNHQRDAHLDRLVHITGVQLRIESTAIEVLHILSENGITTRVLKGMASAELDYPERRFRQSGDVDIAVPHDQLTPCVVALEAHGYRHPETTDSPLLDKGATLCAPNGIEVDIHTSLFQRSVASTLIFADPVPLADLPGSALPATLRLVHAAGHFILTPPGFRRLSGLIDVTRLRTDPLVEIDHARELASELNVEQLVGAALHLEAQLSGTTEMMGPLLKWKQPDWLDRHTRLVPNRRLTLEYLSRFRDVEPGSRLRYLPIWLWPDQRHRQVFRNYSTLAWQRARERVRSGR